ncbi:MAG: universal stress protein [Burkholderiaceae bacterium]
MSYPSILVHLNDSKRLDVLLEAACGLASRSGSHLSGVFVVPPNPLPNLPEISARQDIIEASRRAWQERADTTKQAFERAVAGQPFTSEWREVHAGSLVMAEAVAQQARLADLTITSQGDPDASRNGADVIERVAFDSGRPVLAVPQAGRFKQIGDRVLVAWNGQKEAVRAVHDAMPMLKTAKKVHLLTIVSKREADPINIPGAAIANMLARHGVNCETARLVSGEISVADTLLNYASDHSIDLLVMGCYGHARLRERIFGGATRKILEEMTVPVLMSH